MVTAEFQSLQQTAQLPDWALWEAELANYWLVVGGGTHGDEQDQIEYIRSRMNKKGQFPGALLLIANREAADQKERYTGGKGQMMMHYPGSFEASAANEQRAAAGITWLTSQVAPEHLFLDRHDNSTGNRYACFGYKTTPAAIAAAHILGHTNIIISDGPFYKVEPSSLVTEDVMPKDPAAKERYYAHTDQHLHTIATLGYSGLTSYYYDKNPQQYMSFYERLHEVCIVDQETLAPVEHLLPILPELEAIEPDKWGTPLPLSPQAREIFGLKQNQTYYRETTNYHNWSPILDNSILSITDDKLRRVAWGTITAAHPGPSEVNDEGCVTFG